MDDLYHDHVLDHAENPRGLGSLDNPTHTIEVTNAACGDTFSLDVKVHDGVIEAIRWRGEGCAISQASASLLSEQLEGKTVAEVLTHTDDSILALLGLSDVSYARYKCALSFFWGLRNMLL